MGGSSIARDVRDSASRLYEQKHAKIGKKTVGLRVYAFCGACGAGGGGRNADLRIKTALVGSVLKADLARSALARPAIFVSMSRLTRIDFG